MKEQQRVNTYRAKCHTCGRMVPANGGYLTKEGGQWIVRHPACSDSGAPAVVSYYFPDSGETVIQNKNGRCIDAPCCGCCT